MTVNDPKRPFRDGLRSSIVFPVRGAICLADHPGQETSEKAAKIGPYAGRSSNQSQ